MENVKPTDIKEIAKALKEAGFEVQYYPDKREIWVRGDLEEITVHTVTKIVIRKNDAKVVYDEFAGYSFVTILSNNGEESFVLGDVLSTFAQYKDSYLKLRDKY
jgi:hypothetical protein